MADTDLDPANDPLVPKQYPYPQTSITGIGRIQTPESLGIWDGSDVSGVGFVPGLAGTKKVLSGAGKRIGGALENLTTDPYLAPDETKNQPPAPEVSPAVDDQAYTRGTVPDILAKGQPPDGSLADKLVKTTTEKNVGGRVLNGPFDEARSGSAPSAPSAPTPGGGAAPPPTEPNPQGPTGTPGLLGKFFNNAGNFFDANRMTLMALAGGLAGAQSWGQGLGRGFTAASRVQPQEIALQNQNATMQALVGRGLPPDIARAAAGNPAILQELLPRAFGVKQQKFTQIDHDQYGQPVYGFVDEVNGKVYDLAGKEVTHSSSGGSGNSDVMNLHGEDFLKTVDPARADLIRQIGQGRGAYPTGMMLKTPYGQMLQQQVTQAYPDINAQTFPARQKAWNDWYGGGKHADAMGSITQAAVHGDDLTGTLDALGNVPGGRVVNAPLNMLGDMTGLGKSGENFGPAGMNIHALADELSKIWKGGNNSDAEVRAWEEKFPINGTLDQQKAAMRKAVELYEGGIDKLEKLRRDEFGPVADSLPPVVDPRTGARIAHLKAWANNQPNQPQQYQGAPAAGASPQPVRLDPKNPDAQFNQLPKGTLYIGPDNVPRIK